MCSKMHTTTYTATMRFYVATPTISLSSINGLVFVVERSLFSVRQELKFYVKFIRMTVFRVLIRFPKSLFALSSHSNLH